MNELLQIEGFPRNIQSIFIYQYQSFLQACATMQCCAFLFSLNIYTKAWSEGGDPLLNIHIFQCPEIFCSVIVGLPLHNGFNHFRPDIGIES